MPPPYAKLKPLRGAWGARPHPWVSLACILIIGLCTALHPLAAIIAAVPLGGLAALHARLHLTLAAMVLTAGLLVLPGGVQSIACWLLAGDALLLTLMPRSWMAAVIRLPRLLWLVAALVSACGISAVLLGWGSVPAALAILAATYQGATLSRQLAMSDARLLSWGDEGLATVTRDLLLGRVTSGMLHDLAQPLNVISMANGNMSYIVDHLEISDDERRHLVDRIERIATHTQSAAAILSLFRWFGRDGSDEPAALSVRSALERAIAATRSNVRHHGVAVELQGSGLDYPLPARHGALEMMAVGALLCAFASFIDADGAKRQGKVLLHAALSPAHVVVSVQCVDIDGRPISGRVMDDATNWLLEQVAHEASGDFHAFARDSQPERFLVRLGRDDT